MTLRVLVWVALVGLVGCNGKDPRPTPAKGTTGSSSAAPAAKESGSAPAKGATPAASAAPRADKARTGSAWVCPSCAKKYDAAGWCCGQELQRRP